MKKLNLFHKLTYFLGFIAILWSILSSYWTKQDFTWQIIALFWMLSSFINELRIRDLEDKV